MVTEPLYALVDVRAVLLIPSFLDVHRNSSHDQSTNNPINQSINQPTKSVLTGWGHCDRATTSTWGHQGSASRPLASWCSSQWWPWSERCSWTSSPRTETRLHRKKVKAELGRVEQSVIEHSTPEQSRAEQSRAEQSRAVTYSCVGATHLCTPLHH